MSEMKSMPTQAPADTKAAKTKSIFDVIKEYGNKDRFYERSENMSFADIMAQVGSEMGRVETGFVPAAQEPCEEPAMPEMAQQPEAEENTDLFAPLLQDAEVNEKPALDESSIFAPLLSEGETIDETPDFIPEPELPADEPEVEYADDNSNEEYLVSDEENHIGLEREYELAIPGSNRMASCQNEVGYCNGYYDFDGNCLCGDESMPPDTGCNCDGDDGCGGDNGLECGDEGDDNVVTQPELPDVEEPFVPEIPDVEEPEYPEYPDIDEPELPAQPELPLDPDPVYPESPDEYLPPVEPDVDNGHIVTDEGTGDGSCDGDWDCDDGFVQIPDDGSIGIDVGDGACGYDGDGEGNGFIDGDDGLGDLDLGSHKCRDEQCEGCCSGSDCDDQAMQAYTCVGDNCDCSVYAVARTHCAMTSCQFHINGLCGKHLPCDDTSFTDLTDRPNCGVIPRKPYDSIFPHPVEEDELTS